MSVSILPPSSSTQARLAAAPVPERVRRLLEAIHAVVVQMLDAPLHNTMVELERELFKQAEKARSTQAQSELYAEMRQLRLHSQEFPNRFQNAMAAQLAELKARTDKITETEAPAFKALTLVADTDIDRDIILYEMARRETSRAATALLLLGQRFGVLAAQPGFTVEQLPVGPQALSQVLRECGDQLQLGLDAQLTLYQVFDRQVSERYGEMIDRINILLAHEGVLPGLVYQPYLARSGSPRRGNTRKDSDTGARASQRPLTSWQGQAPATSWASAMADSLELGTGAAAAGGSPATGMPSRIPAAGGNAGAMAHDAAMAPGGPLPAGSSNALSADHAAQGSAANGPGTAAGDTLSPGMSALHNMLGAARASLAQGSAVEPGGLRTPAGTPSAPSGPPSPLDSGPAAATTGGASVQTIASAEIMTVLGRLQSQAAAQGADGVRRTIADIHKAVLAQMRAEHGADAALTLQDTNTLDLLGMLYNQIQREVRNEAPATDLLQQLQVPVVRAAISDQAFFVRDQHPARELLNAVAESGATWLSDDDTDPVLLQKLGEAVNRVVTEYQGDESVFADANQEIQGHLKAAARKAEVAERRHVDAARGKERLEAAKQLATHTVDQLCQRAELPKFVQTLLRQAWSDVLTLTLLRNGEQSDEWRERLQASQKIADITTAPVGSGTDIAFGNQLEESLLQVGYHRDEAGAIARRLATPGGEDDVTSRTELSAKLKSHSRLGQNAGKDSADTERKKPERNEDEEKHYRQLRTLPFGTWFEFVTNQQGDTRRQRLSWYSLITDNALFVNQRGQKVSEQSLDGLSRLMAQGQVRIVTEDKGRLIDRAWQATLRTLRSLSGGAPRTQTP